MYSILGRGHYVTTNLSTIVTEFTYLVSDSRIICTLSIDCSIDSMILVHYLCLSLSDLVILIPLDVLLSTDVSLCLGRGIARGGTRYCFV